MSHIYKEMNYVYILRCADDTLYCGWTTDLQNRIKAHNDGKGAKYTRSRLPARLVYYEEYEDKGEALSREWHIKRMSREAKLMLIRTAAHSSGRSPVSEQSPEFPRPTVFHAGSQRKGSGP